MAELFNIVGWILNIATFAGGWINVGYIVIGFFVLATGSALIFAMTTGIFKRDHWRGEVTLIEKPGKSNYNINLAFLLSPLKSQLEKYLRFVNIQKQSFLLALNRDVLSDS